MATVREIFDWLDQRAPFRYQLDFDNAGFLVGRGERQVQRCLVALDITPAVIDEAIALDCQLIVAHHPVIWGKLGQVTDETITGQKVLTLVEKGIAAICAHTNLDAVEGGVNTQLAQRVGLKETVPLETDGTDEAGHPYGIGRVGTVRRPELSVREYAAFVKERLNAANVRFVGGGKPVQRVAVGGGACGSMLEDVVAQGCDTFVTSDLKYNQFLDAKALGLNLLDAGHFPTENVVCGPMVQWLSEAFPKVEVRLSEVHREVYKSV